MRYNNKHTLEDSSKGKKIDFENFWVMYIMKLRMIDTKILS